MHFDRIKSDLEGFLRGLHEVVARSAISVFEPSELLRLVSGQHAIDVADWRQHARCVAHFFSRAFRLHAHSLTHYHPHHRYDGGLTEGDPLVLWFWDCVETKLNEAQRQRLLQFVTGSNHVPVGGFRELRDRGGSILPFTLRALPRPAKTKPLLVKQLLNARSSGSRDARAQAFRSDFCVAHTCFNRLELPRFESKEQLARALVAQTAIDVTGFDRA